jgi:ligand-binding sensor domain-containing protein
LKYNKKAKSKSASKWILRIAGVLIALTVLLYSVLVLAKDLLHSQPVPGIRVFLEKTDVCSMALGENMLWAGGSDGLFKLTRSTPQPGDAYKAEKIGDYQYIKAVLLDGDKLWIGHDNGLTLIQNGETRDFTEKDGLPDHRVNALCLDTGGNLWVGTWGGVAVFKDNKIVRTLRKEEGLIDDMVNVILQDSRGGMWFGSYVAPRGGISILYHGNWQVFSTQDALEHSNINTIIELNSTDVLVGGGLYTQGGGTMFSFRDGRWTKGSALTKRDGLAGAKIRSLLEDSKGRLWVGSEYEGLAILVNGTSLIMTNKNGLSNNEVKSIKEEKDGTIWIGTREGVVRIDKGGNASLQTE